MAGNSLEEFVNSPWDEFVKWLGAPAEAEATIRRGSCKFSARRGSGFRRRMMSPASDPWPKIDTSGKSPAYVQHRKNLKPARETGRGLFESDGSRISQSLLSRGHRARIRDPLSPTRWLARSRLIRKKSECQKCP
jgi:hypothetical protein